MHKITDKITINDRNVWTLNKETTNQNKINVPKIVEPTNKKKLL